jgi:hypothetical protein
LLHTTGSGATAVTVLHKRNASWYTRRIATPIRCFSQPTAAESSAIACPWEITMASSWLLHGMELLLSLLLAV